MNGGIVLNISYSMCNVNDTSLCKSVTIFSITYASP